MKLRYAVVVVGSLCGVPATAHAQVNAEALRSALTTTPKFISLSSSLTGNAGNTNTVTYSGAVFAGLLSEPNLVFVKASADFGEASGITNTAKWVAHARYTYRVDKLVSPETFAQVQHDRFKRLSIRDLYGAGLRFSLYESKDTEIFAGTSYMVEHEVLSDIPGSPGTNNVWQRSSDYLGFNYNVTSFMNASSVVYVQPRWAHPLDFRVLSDSVFTFTLSKRWSVGTSGTIWYDNRPPAGVHTYDLSIKNSITLVLQ